MSAHDDERAKLTRINIPELPSYQEVCQEQEFDLSAILKSLQELEEREVEQENYDEAEKAKFKFDLITNKKLEIDRTEISKKDAITKRNYKEAKLMKTKHGVNEYNEIKRFSTGRTSASDLCIDEYKLSRSSLLITA